MPDHVVSLALLNTGSIDGVWKVFLPADIGLKPLPIGRKPPPPTSTRSRGKRFRIANAHFQAGRLCPKQDDSPIGKNAELHA
ncbi:hypothetical protein LGN17_33360 [Burkholderia sp. AU30280]|uniref:hypothetical protein n=1 Tax=Burkholderia sp. AU30280 TaxID=2879628 RepID=UPI001CF1E359|nr:hypothetical protein [Burkholderia sp. AU30280]MCA8277378.1 hypothetical protein [Burkholderia sp. AU30280]